MVDLLMTYLPKIDADITSPLTAFGEVMTATATPEVQVLFTYGTHPAIHDTRANQSGTVTTSNGQLVLQTGAAANSSAELLSKRSVRYDPGQGVVARMTGAFTTGVSGSTQLVGIGDQSEGYFFGYNGTSFGTLHRYGGRPEIRTLTVSTASSHAENITITLDGDANASVAVTASGVITTTANEIAAADYTSTGRGWTAQALGDTVVFVSWESATQGGTYSLSGATSAVGTFAQTLAAVAPTDTWTAKASWSEDVMDGSGPSGMTLDPTKGNVYQITFQYLGYGGIVYSIEDESTGLLTPVHFIPYTNANTRPSLDNPTLPLYAGAINAANTSNLTVNCGSMMGSIQGKDQLTGPRFGYEQTRTNITSSEVPIISLASPYVFRSLRNRVKSKILRIALAVEHTKPVRVRFYVNPTLTGAAWADVSANISVMKYDTTATAFTGGTFLAEIPLGKAGNYVVELSADDFAGVIEPGNYITATAEANSGTNAEVTVAFNWVERQ
jgi:hypothetical protein